MALKAHKPHKAHSMAQAFSVVEWGPRNLICVYFLLLVIFQFVELDPFKKIVGQIR